MPQVSKLLFADYNSLKMQTLYCEHVVGSCTHFFNVLGSQHRSWCGCHGNRQGDIGGLLSSNEGALREVAGVFGPRLVTRLPGTKGLVTIETRDEVIVSTTIPTLARRKEEEIVGTMPTYVCTGVYGTLVG